MAESDFLVSDNAADSPADQPADKAPLPVGWIMSGVLAIVATSYATYWSYQWLAVGDAAVVGALGTALGIGGLLSAYLGFGLTFWQLLRTARSADAAAKAVYQVKRDYNSFDAMAELSSAKGWNESIRTSLAGRDREAAKARYDRLRESIIRIAASPHALQNSVSSRLKDEAVGVVDATTTLREVIDDGDIPWNQMITSLEKLDSYMISVSQSLRDSIRG